MPGAIRGALQTIRRHFEPFSVTSIHSAYLARHLAYLAADLAAR